MKTKLELTLEGKVSTDSGKLLIIDPCYLDNFDFSAIEKFEDEYEKKVCKLMRMDMESFKLKYSAILPSTPKNPDEMDALAIKKYLKAMDEYAKHSKDNREKSEQLRKEFKQEQEQFREEPSLNPPYIAQTDNYVYFHNGMGDGFYPIVQTKERIKIVFDYPINSKGKTDESRLNGKLLGHSSVDSGTQIITDLSNVIIKKSIRPDLYCIVDVSKRKYKCKFNGARNFLSI